jgi:basic membrane protein A
LAATLVGLVLVVFALALVPARRPALAEAKGATSYRVGLVFDVGGRGDKSFNDAAYEGLARAQRELGVQAEMVEPPSGNDREAALRLFASRGFDLVLGVGFIFSRDVDVVARDYPGVRFACVDYGPAFDASGHMLPIPANVTGLAFREEEGSFLVGAAAGLASRHRVVGFVGGMDIPLIHKFEAGYRAGVAASCASCEVRVAYAGSTPDAFRDPAKGKAIALAQIESGADVIFHASGASGHGVFEAARTRGVLAIGVDADQWDEAPNVVLTSMIKRADVAVFEAIDAAEHRRLAGGMRVIGLREGGLDWVHEGPHAVHVDAAMRATVDALRAKIVDGAIAVPDH